MTDRPDLVARLCRVGSAALADAGARVVDRRIASLWAGAITAGPVVTAHCAFGDNLAVQVAVVNASPGDVLVVDAGGSDATVAVWGEVLTVAAESRGIAGVVLDGLTRDADAVIAKRFPMWCVGRSPSGPTKAGPGSVGGALAVGGIDVNPGDWIVADGDGVAVINETVLDVALAQAEAKAEREQHWFSSLRGGATTLALFGLSSDAIERQ